MNRWHFGRRSLSLCLSIIIAGALAHARPANKEYQPQVGQEGKDVIWAPTPQPLVDKMLDMAKVTPKDYVIDLGSGDGRIVISAAKRGARALGIEYNPDMVELSKRNAAREGVSKSARFIKADLFESDFSKATVITMFLLPEINFKLRTKIFAMKPGARVVSNSFEMGEWNPDETANLNNCSDLCTAHLWIVPAKVGGRWKLTQGELTLKQNFQMISGTLKSGGNAAQITHGKLNGNQISFTLEGAQYRGQVKGNTIEGIIKSGDTESKWRALRAR